MATSKSKASKAKATTVAPSADRVRFTITITNNRGKVLLEKESERQSVRAVHRVARELFQDQPAGSHMTIKTGKKVVMTWTMHKDGYTFEHIAGVAPAATFPTQRRTKVA